MFSEKSVILNEETETVNGAAVGLQVERTFELTDSRVLNSFYDEAHIRLYQPGANVACGAILTLCGCCPADLHRIADMIKEVANTYENLDENGNPVPVVTQTVVTETVIVDSLY